MVTRDISLRSYICNIENGFQNCLLRLETSDQRAKVAQLPGLENIIPRSLSYPPLACMLQSKYERVSILFLFYVNHPVRVFTVPKASTWATVQLLLVLPFGLFGRPCSGTPGRTCTSCCIQRWGIRRPDEAVRTCCRGRWLRGRRGSSPCGS